MSGHLVNLLFADLGGWHVDELEQRNQFQGVYPIFYALLLHDAQWLDSLLTSGANLSVLNPHSGWPSSKFEMTVLGAALRWNLAVARKVIQAGATPSNLYPEIVRVFQSTSYSALSSEHRSYILKFLFESGVDPNTDGCIVYSIDLKDPVSLILCHEYGAKLQSLHVEAGALLHLAVKCSSWRCLKVLIEEFEANIHTKATIRLQHYDCAYKDLWAPPPGGRAFSVNIDAIEYAAYLGKLGALNKCLGTSYAPPAKPVISPFWTRRSKAEVMLRKHVLKK
jgi:hypothetical protein